jgi:HAD superfamily phosphatase (TIGR01668 family)
VHKFNEKLDVLTIFKANKPSEKNYLKAVSMMNLSKEEVVFIGDQIFTDIWGAKKAGIKNILVSPIHPKEEIQIVLKRIIEKPILAEYKKMNKKQEA